MAQMAMPAARRRRTWHAASTEVTAMATSAMF